MSRRIGTLLATLLFPLAARACPFCDGGAAGVNQVRAAIFGPDFGWHVAAMLLPFPIFLGVAALIYFGIPFRRRPAATPADGVEP